MNRKQLTQFLETEFQQVADDFEIILSRSKSLQVIMRISDKHLRPGGTVSGPSMFALADVAFYLAILEKIGPKALSVTTSATINFMRKPSNAPLLAIPKIHKLGKQLVVGNVMIYAVSDNHLTSPIASASLTYSIPPVKA